MSKEKKPQPYYENGVPFCRASCGFRDSSRQPTTKCCLRSGLDPWLCEPVIREMATELAKLRAIVDKLPKTADGVPVVPGDTLWSYEEWAGRVGETNEFIWSACSDKDCFSKAWYSTRAACEAAKEGE